MSDLSKKTLNPSGDTKTILKITGRKGPTLLQHCAVRSCTVKIQPVAARDRAAFAARKTAAYP